MNFLKKAWAGVKSGFNWIKKHKAISFLVGGTIIGTALGMYMGFPLLTALAGGAAATLGLFAIGGAVFGAGVLVGGLVLLAAMGIGHLLGIGKKKDKEAPAPAVAPADPSPVAVDCPPDGVTRIGDTPALGETGPLGVNDLDLAPTGQRGQANLSTGQRGQLSQADQAGPSGLGFANAMTDDPIQPTAIQPAEIAPTPITDASISPTSITDAPALPMEAPLKTLDMPLGEPVG